MMDRPGRGSSGQGVRQGAGALLLAALGYLPATVGIASPPEVPFHTGHDPATLVAAASGTPAHPAPSAAPGAPTSARKGTAAGSTPHASTDTAAGSTSPAGPYTRPGSNGEILYTVQPGDTLLGLSQHLLDTPERWHDVQKLNDIPRPRRLQPGTTLRLLPGWLKPHAERATLETASNEVKINGKPAHDGDHLPEGTTVKTGPDSAALITLPDGTRLRIPSATEVRLERLRAYHGEKDLDAGFLLRHGGIEPDSPGKRSRPLNIRTPSGNAAVRGTHFRVHAENKRSTVEVLRGQVAAGNRRSTTPVDAGQGAWFTAKGKPTVTPLPPAPELTTLSGRTWHETAPQLPLPARDAQTAAWHVEVSTRQDFGAMVLDTRTQAPAFTLPSRQDGPHFVRVSRISPTGIEGYAGLAEISILARPLPPKLQPQAAEVQVNRDHPLMFVWQAVPDEVALPQRYRLQVAADAGFRTILHDTVVDTRSARIQPDTRRPLARWWRVAAIEGEGAHQKQGPFSAAQRFVLKVDAPIVEAKPRPFVRASDGEPIHTGHGDMLIRAD
jgi:peptidoglycan-binding lysM